MKQFLLVILFCLLSITFVMADTITLLVATTDADQSNTFTVLKNEVIPVIFTGTVGSGETGDIQIWDGAAWVSDSTQLTDTELIRVVVGPGLFRVDKSATAAAAGIAVSR